MATLFCPSPSRAPHGTITTFLLLVVVEWILEGRGLLMITIVGLKVKSLSNMVVGDWKQCWNWTKWKNACCKPRNQRKIRTKIKKTTKHTFQIICCKEDAIRKHVVQRLSCRKNESSTCAKNNYNEQSWELK